MINFSFRLSQSSGNLFSVWVLGRSMKSLHVWKYLFLPTCLTLFYCLPTSTAAVRSDGSLSPFPLFVTRFGLWFGLWRSFLYLQRSEILPRYVLLFVFSLRPIQPFCYEDRGWGIFFYCFLPSTFSVFFLRLLLSRFLPTSLSLNSSFIFSISFLFCSTFLVISLTFSS